MKKVAIDDFAIIKRLSDLTVSPDGQNAHSDYTTLEQHGRFSLVALTPRTGRTHQLRVHCAHMGFPILGDPQYGSEESIAYSRKRSIPHQLLCAKSLELTHPVTGEKLLITSQMDAVLPPRHEE